MKKSKIILVTFLALALCFACLESTTFSWFNRPQETTGGKFSWSVTADDNVLANTSKDGLSMSTYQGTLQSDGSIEYNEATNITSFTNSTGIPGNKSNYYHTVISNSSSSNKTVSLYFPTVSFPSASTTTKFCLGVNGPTRTHKYYGPNSVGSDTSSTKVDFTDYFRIYVQLKNEDACLTNWPIDGTVSYEVKYGVDSLTASKALTKLADYDGHALYYVDIPTTSKHIQFQRTNTSTSYYQSQEFTDIITDGQSTSNSLLFYNSNDYYGGYNNCQFGKSTFAAGIGFMKYYNSITLNVGDTFNAALTGGTDYHKSNSGTLTYYADSSHLATMIMTGSDTGQNTTGQIKALAVGTSTLYTKIVGECGDAMQMETTVTVLRSGASANTNTDVPLVTNLLIPAAEGGIDATVDIYWYIKNDSSTNGMTYTIPNLYMTL